MKYIFSTIILIGSLKISAQHTAGITVTFDAAPSNVSVKTAPLRYNKDFAYSFTFDDGKEDAYTNGFPLLNGGKASDGQTYPGLYFTDGCGNPVKFKAGIAWTSKNLDGQDVHTNTPGLMNWTQLKDLYNSGWNVLNHSLSHATGDGTDYDYQVKENARYVKEKTGIPLKQFVIPSGDIGYIQAATDNGFKAIYNQHSFPGADGLDVSGNFDLQNFRFFRRFMSDQDYNASDISQWTDKVASASGDNKKLWYSEFTHHISNEPLEGSLLFSTFSSYMNYLEDSYGRDGRDIMWFAPLQEVYEYIYLARTVNPQVSVSGNQAFISMDFENVPDNFDKYALSLLITSDKNIVSAESDADHSAFQTSGSDKLVNLEWNSKPVTITPASINNYKKEGNPGIYPNPVTDRIYFNTFTDEKINYLISDAAGNSIKMGQLSSSVQNLNISEISQTGLFFLILTDESGNRRIMKFIKE
jgi:hypothetical protein